MTQVCLAVAMNFFDNFLDDTHVLTRDMCRRFAETEIAPHAHEWEEEGLFPVELYGKTGAAGIIGIGFEESVGGAGGEPMHVVMAIEGLMRGGSTGVVVGVTTAGIAVPPMIQSGDQALIDRWVRPVLAGELIAALAVTEPGTGSDVSAIRTRAVRDGDHYVVTGNKIFISSGVRADVLTTLVRTGPDPHGGLSFLAIDASLDGVDTSRSLKKTGWCASDTAEIGFDEVRVPVSALIGAEGTGFLTVMRNFQAERLALAAYGAATAQIALDEAIAYARERHAFGKPLTGFQVTRHKLADMATQVTTARTLVYQVAQRMGAGQEVVAEVSMAKNFAAQTAVNVTYEAVQIHGGMGYMRETLVERLSRDARLLPIGGGTQEVMKEIIAKRLGF
jgi:acyl-CoA dehydrogenase